MTYTAEMLKSDLPPERYRTARLNGSYGKPTGQGWHTWNGLSMAEVGDELNVSKSTVHRRKKKALEQHTH